MLEKAGEIIYDLNEGSTEWNHVTPHNRFNIQKFKEKNIQTKQNKKHEIK